MTRNINVPNFVPNFKDARDAHELETSNSDVDISKGEKERNPTNPDFNMSKVEQEALKEKKLEEKVEQLAEGRKIGEKVANIEQSQIRADKTSALAMVAPGGPDDLWPPVTHDPTKNIEVASKVGGTEVKCKK